jgi:hypothetical protein
MARPQKIRRISARDLALVGRAYRCARLQGYSPQAGVRIIAEARHRGVPISLAFGLIEQESAFRHIFGHDGGGAFPGQAVTKARVKALIASRRWNGISLTQLTWHGYVSIAERDGGAHKASVCIATGMDILGDLVKQHGQFNALRIYNDGNTTSVKGLNYARSVVRRASRYHRALT